MSHNASPATSPTLRFGIFDWLDDSRHDYAETFEQRLKMLEYADQAGFYAYHLAEHHGTPLAMCPSPNLFLSLVAQRTRHIRFGPMVYTLPMYHPIRLAEEICVLDQLSHGRAELGMGRSASPFEAGLFNVKMDDARDMAHEALEVILQGLATGRVTHHGKFYDFDDVELTTRPYQRPYPPMWYPALSATSIPWVAEQGFNLMVAFLFASPEACAGYLAQYRELLAQHRDAPNRLNGHVTDQKDGFVLQIYVADTDAEAMRDASEAHKVWFSNFNYLWVLGGNPERHASRASFENFMHQGMAIAGSPETVRATLQHYLDLTGANYIAGAFAFGDLTDQQVLRSLHLFKEQVMPRLVVRTESGIEAAS